MGNRTGRVSKLERRSAPKAPELELVLTFHTEEERAAAEAAYLANNPDPNSPLKQRFVLYEDVTLQGTDGRPRTYKLDDLI